MGKRGKRGDKPAAKKALLKRIDALAKKLEEELKGAELFGPPPPTDDCGICLVPLPRVGKKVYQGCCGKIICNACTEQYIAAITKMILKNQKNILACPFCRVPAPIDTEWVRQLEVRASKGDVTAYNCLGKFFCEGGVGVGKDEMKALHYFTLGAELGSADACGIISSFFETGRGGVPVDKAKAASFDRAGALRGNIVSRHTIGCLEYDEFSNHELGVRHWKIAAAAGCQPSLKRLRDIYNADGKNPGKEFIEKDELDSIYRMGHDAQIEVKTEERENHFEGEDFWRC